MASPDQTVVVQTKELPLTKYEAVSVQGVSAGPVSIGTVTADTGNPYLDIGGVVFIVLAIGVGFRLIFRYIPSASRTRKKPD